MQVYKCQNGKPSEGGCGFWLWDDESKAREEAAVLNNSGAEPHLVAVAPAPDNNSRTRPLLRTASPSSSPFSSQETVSNDTLGAAIAPSPRRCLAWRTDSSQDSHGGYGDPPAGEGRREGTRAAESMMPPRTTPRKDMRDTYSSPNKRKFSFVEREWDSGLPTPDTGRASRDACTTSSYAVNRIPTLTSQYSADSVLGGSSQLSASQTPPATPTPLRPNETGSDEENDSLARDVFDALGQHSVHLPTGARESLAKVLKKHSLRTQGIIKG